MPPRPVHARRVAGFTTVVERLARLLDTADTDTTVVRAGHRRRGRNATCTCRQAGRAGASGAVPTMSAVPCGAARL